MLAIEKLQTLVNRAQSQGISKLPSADVRAFASTYRNAVSELAEHRARGAPATQMDSMEAVLIRAHAILYAPERVHLDTAFASLFSAFPQAVAAGRRHLGAAALLLLVGCAWGYLEVKRDPGSATTLLPGSWQNNAEESFQADATHSEGSPIRGAFYFTHNATIAFNAYALGVTAGVGSAYMALYNGVILGATFAVVQDMASPRAFFSFIAAHSGVELFAILVAITGGLQMGEALLRPGVRRRRDALSDAARTSLPLALGAACLLAIAGVTEGWISPMPLPLSVKVSIGGTLDALVVLYVWLGVRGKPQASQRASNTAKS